MEKIGFALDAHAIAQQNKRAHVIEGSFPKKVRMFI